jgi:hypothetical protein
MFIAGRIMKKVIEETLLPKTRVLNAVSSLLARPSGNLRVQSESDLREPA